MLRVNPNQKGQTWRSTLFINSINVKALLRVSGFSAFSIVLLIHVIPILSVTAAVASSAKSTDVGTLTEFAGVSLVAQCFFFLLIAAFSHSEPLCDFVRNMWTKDYWSGDYRSGSE
jgi:hypothetical protein